MPSEHVMTIRFNWGTGLALAYAAFAAATTGFVAFAMSRPVVLVRADYYQESLRQDARMQAERNARELGGSASIAVDGDRLVVAVPRGQAGTARGTVTLYRASDDAADRVFDLAVDRDGRQGVSIRGIAPGHWVVQLRWDAAGREYYVERPVVVQ
jgi:hypothetical protein